jgi:hypothetical protein
MNRLILGLSSLLILAGCGPDSSRGACRRQIIDSHSPRERVSSPHEPATLTDRLAERLAQRR